MVVASGILGSNENLYSEVFFEIEKRLLHISDDHRNIVNARFSKLANEAFDKHLATHFEHGLRLLKRQRGKTARRTCSENDRIVYAMRREGVFAKRRHTPFPIKETKAFERFACFVNGAKGHPGFRRDFALSFIARCNERA